MAVNWHLVKEDYIARNLRGPDAPPVSLKDTALAWRIPYKTLRNRAASEHWREELRNRSLERATELASRLRAQDLADETALRLRHAETARLAIHKALERLSSMAADELSARDVIELLKLGLSEERKALGIGDQPDQGMVQTRDENRQAPRARIEVLGAALLRFVDEAGEGRVIDGDNER